MSKLARYTIAFILLLLLVFVRLFEDALFYDPYLKFFKNDYLYMDSPRRETLKLVLNTVLRYIINSALSVGVLYMAFWDKRIVKFSVILYAAALAVLLILYLYFVINPRQEDYYLFFNIRRFLIQPVGLLVLVPAFYYHRMKR